MYDSLWPQWTVACQCPLPMDFPGKNTGVGSHSLLPGTFPTQGLNPDFSYCRQIIYHLSHQGSPHGVDRYFIYKCNKGNQVVIHICRPNVNTCICICADTIHISQAASGKYGKHVPLVAQPVKNPLAVCEIWVLSLGWEDPLEESMATHSSILAWRIPSDREAWWTTGHAVTKSQGTSFKRTWELDMRAG